MGDDRRLVEWKCSKNSGKDLMTTINKQMDSFQTWGRSAQLLLLEFGGYWDRINYWMKNAIDAKDVNLIKDLLNLLIKMPTCSGQLMANKNGVPWTVQELLETVARPGKRGNLEAPEFGSKEDKEAIKWLCCDLYVKWLKIKKRNLLEIDKERIPVETEFDGMGAIAKIAGRTDFVFLAVNGRVSLMKMGRMPPPAPPQLAILPPPSPPTIPPTNGHAQSPESSPPQTSLNNGHDEDTSSSDSDSMEVDIEAVSDSESVTDSKVPEEAPLPVQNHLPKPDTPLRPTSKPRVFRTSRSRSDNLLEEMLHPSKKVAPPQKSPPSPPPPEIEILEEPEPPVPSPPEIIILEETEDPSKEATNSPTLPQDDEEPEIIPIFPNFEHDLGQPKKRVTWSNDAIPQIFSYETNVEYERKGFRNEKWISFELPEEYDPFSADSSSSSSSDSESDRLVIDEKPSGKPNHVPEEIPWKLFKIFPAPKSPPRLKSTEVHYQKSRVGSVPKATCSAYPEEIWEDKDLKLIDDDDDIKVIENTVRIPVEDNIGRNVFKTRDTEIYDHRGAKWPEPKGEENTLVLEASWSKTGGASSSSSKSKWAKDPRLN